MKVQEIMTHSVRSCRPDTNLAEAVRDMWEADCGALPVIDAENHVIGVITDRDICVAVATRGRTADRIAVREVVDGRVHTCLAGDDTTAVLNVMKAQKVRRLPVIDPDGHLQGIVSFNDIATHAGAATATQIAGALAAICAHRPAIAAPSAA